MATWSADDVDVLAEAREALPSDDWDHGPAGCVQSLAHGIALKYGSWGWSATRIERVGAALITHEWYNGRTPAEAIRRQQLALVNHVLES